MNYRILVKRIKEFETAADGTNFIDAEKVVIKKIQNEESTISYDYSIVEIQNEMREPDKNKHYTADDIRHARVLFTDPKERKAMVYFDTKRKVRVWYQKIEHTNIENLNGDVFRIIVEEFSFYENRWDKVDEYNVFLPSIQKEEGENNNEIQ